MVGLGVGCGCWRRLDWTKAWGAWADTVDRYGVPPRATCLNALVCINRRACGLPPRFVFLCVAMDG